MAEGPDAIVVGAGPNGLAAAIALARAGRSVRVLEAEPEIGGGTRTEELTLPGFRHDVCSAIHPLTLASPALSLLPLEEHGLRFVQPDLALAHPLDGGTAAALHRSVDDTASSLGADAAAYRRLIGPAARDWRPLMDDLLGPPVRPPRHPIATGRFGLLAIRSAAGLARARFATEPARALVAGNAAHAMQPLENRGTAAFALMLQMLGHGVGWPVAVGGSAAITDAMASLLRSLGGEIETGAPVTSLADVEGARAVLMDVTPRALLRIAGDALPRRYAGALRAVPLRPGRLQAGLRALGAGAVGGRGAAAGGHRARRRDAGRDLRVGGGGGARHPSPAALRAGRPAEPVRSQPRARGQAHAVGVLPRAQRIERST